MLISLMLMALLDVAGVWRSCVVDIHDVPIVPAAAFIPDWLPACCCWLHYFVQASLLLLAPLLFWRSSAFAFILAVEGGHASSLGRYVFGSEISYNKAPPRLPGLGC